MDNQPVFQLTIRPNRGHARAVRVLPDGRYEVMDGQSLTKASIEDTTQPNLWRSMDQYSDEEMAKLQSILVEVDFANLETEYHPSTQVSDGNIVMWDATVDDQLKRVTVYPGAKIPALDQLLKRFNQIRKPVRQRSNWRIWDGAIFHQCTVIGNVHSAEMLRPLVQALYSPLPAEQSAENSAEMPPSGDPEQLLIAINWYSEPDNLDETTLYQDGRYQNLRNAEVSESRQFDSQRMSAVAEAIDAIDWAALPDQIEV